MKSQALTISNRQKETKQQVRYDVGETTGIWGNTWVNLGQN